MVIKFTCPNGHPLSCPDERAGRQAKCPKCGEPFTVPESSTEEPVEIVSPDAIVSIEEFPDEDLEGTTQLSQGGPIHFQGNDPDETTLDTPLAQEPIQQSPQEIKPDDDVIAFLCPNGHELTGPSSLQGKPGQCPHCGEKFRIPHYDDDDIEEVQQPIEVVDQEDIEVTGVDPEQVPDGFSEVPVAEGGFGGPEIHVDDDVVEPVVLPSLPAPGEGSAIAAIFTFLWDHRGPDGIVEIFIKEGELLTPTWYAPELSHQSHGVFAVEAADESYTITTIPWDSVTRVALRKVDQLPDDTFE